MITANPITCKKCKATRYNVVLFIGGEFAYQCPECETIHLFYENLFFDINENFKEERWNRFSCIFNQSDFANNKGISEIRDPKSAEKFSNLLCFRYTTEKPIKIDKIKLSNREPDGQFFVASMLHDHFQEGFRALYHLIGNQQIKGYRILIVPEDWYDELLELHKIKQIDEIWRVTHFTKEMRWPYAGVSFDYIKSWQLSKGIQAELDQLEGLAVCITKRAGAVPNGRNLLKHLLEPIKCEPLITLNNELILEKHVGILIHSDSEIRAGLNKKEDLVQIANIVEKNNLKPLLIATTQYEQGIACSTGLPTVYVNSITKQAQLYRDCISLIIGTNCSGCNIPALYDLPMFIYVKERKFPDDFYCFARMASRYDKNLWPWYGDLEKAENIHEYLVSKKNGIEIEESFSELNCFINKSIHQKADYVLEENTYRCIKCNTINIAINRGFYKTDLYYEFKCKCGHHYLTRFGLTTRSFVESREVIDSDREIFEKQKSKLQRITYRERSDPIYIPLLKGSIADFYYMLPTILHLRRAFPKRSLCVITHRKFKDLIPVCHVDEYILLETDSPYQLQRDRDDLEKMINDVISHGSVVNNYPGILPHIRNCYYAINKYYHRRRVCVNDVLIYCRLGNRKWPSPEQALDLLQRLDVKVCILLFVDNDQQELDSLWSKIPNLIINPDIEMQLELAYSSRIMISAHGASQVIPCIANMQIIELETIDPWWTHPEPQPLRFGISFSYFYQIKVSNFKEVNNVQITSEIIERLY